MANLVLKGRSCSRNDVLAGSADFGGCGRRRTGRPDISAFEYRPR